MDTAESGKFQANRWPLIPPFQLSSEIGNAPIWDRR